MEYGAPNEQIAPSNGIEIAYDERGDTSDPALLLVCGLGSQMIFWDNAFCDMLAERGFRVIRYDNRDNGHSTILNDGGIPDQVSMMLGIPRDLAYRLEDMAADGMGLLDHLGIDKAHIAGVSMGGMIVQTMAIHHSDRIRSMCSIMSRTGSLKDALPGPKQMLALLRVGPDELEPYLEHSRQLWATIGSPAYPPDPMRLDALVTEAFNRGLHKAGSARQLHAINCQPNRKHDLQKLDMPALVMHGTADRLVYPRGGRATAQAIPNARLRLFEGMGHDLPVELWPQYVAEIASNANRAVGQPVAA
jgi:pimeloyl-ACP methyl ester carboxylesterase